MKRRAFYLILITTVSMAVIYVPYTVTGFIGNLTEQHVLALWFTAVFCAASSFSGPCWKTATVL